jgi:hypothetical protein
MLECYAVCARSFTGDTTRDRLVTGRRDGPIVQQSAPRLSGLLHPADAVFDLLLVLRLGQFSLSDLNQLGRDRGLEEALDEAHEFSR